MEKIKNTFTVSSAEEMRYRGEVFAKKLKGGDIVALYGDLGSGKTTFVQGMAKGFGIKRRIISPTFIIVRTYRLHRISKRKRALYFYHSDLYRVKSLDDIRGLGIQEIIGDLRNIVAIEWAEKMGNLLPEKRWDIHFAYQLEDKRLVQLERR